MLVAGVILLIYAWIHIATHSAVATVPLVGDAVALLAGVALILSIVVYAWVAAQATFWSTYSIFAALSLAVGLLIYGSGGASSPFIAIWILLCVFAGIFGGWGLVPLFAAATGYLIIGSIGGTLQHDSLVTAILAGELPLIASYIIWHARGGGEQSKDKAYRELASELSQVAGKSEVVINAITDGVIALDGQGTIQLINPAAQQLIGWGKQDALGLNYKSVVKLADTKGSDLDDTRDPIALVLATNREVASNEYMLITNAGKKLMISLVISPVGQIGTGVIIVLRDITREKEEDRQQAEFISTASHEMRTPVASIEGYLGLALNPATAQIDDKARDFITKAHESAQHLGRLFQDLLDVSKADDGRLSNNPKVTDMVEFTHDIVRGLTPKAEAKGLRVLYKPMPDGAEHMGDRQLNPVYYANLDNDHLREVIANLVENAIKYTLKGDVVVDVTGDTEHVRVSIADSGIGIPKEDQAHLFQKFYRVDNSDTREIGGTGLGLYLCRRLTEAMDGRIWVESEYKRGSTFYVEFPRLDHEEATRLIESAGLEPEVDLTPQIVLDAPQAPIAATPAAPAVSPQAPYNAQSGASLPSADLPQPERQRPAQEADGTADAAIAAQPVAIPSPQPRSTPITTTAPATLQSRPAYAPGVTAAPVFQPGTRPNTPLTSIEQNPSQYISRAPSMNIPPRNRPN